ncbi:MAG TPA: type II secretion system protein [Acidimicrobiales bacterium]|nr:type II secretion system protein [Acidimicrobiales bacterium]
MSNTLNQLKREEGFTLIELMIVMVVLGILAGIVIFAVDPFETAATNAKAGADADICATAAAAAKAGGGTANDYVEGSPC